MRWVVFQESIHSYFHCNMDYTQSSFSRLSQYDRLLMAAQTSRRYNNYFARLTCIDGSNKGRDRASIYSV